MEQVTTLERSQAEEELRESEERLKNILDSVHAGIMIIDAETHKIVDANPAAVKMIGAPKEEIVGSTCHEYLCPTESEKCPITDFGQEVDSSERVLIKADGGAVPILKTLVPVMLKGRKHLVENFIDITDHKQMEKALQTYAEGLEEANHLKEIFTDVIRHDLLNPLYVILRMNNLAIDKNASDAEKNQAIEMTLRSAKKMERILYDATKLAKIGTTKRIEFEELDLNNILTDSITSITPHAQKKGISIEKNQEGKYPIKANIILEEVFDNLLSNAVKYGPKDSKIEVSIEEENGSWKVSIKDWGKGVPNQHKKDIFERFKRRTVEGVEGSGLGLAIAKKVAELHHGKIWVEDNPRGGSIFCVILPRVKRDSEGKKKQE